MIAQGLSNALGTKSKCQRVIVVGVVLDSAEQREDVLLFATLDVFVQGGGDGVFPGTVAAELLGFGNQVVVDGEVGRRHGLLPVPFRT